MLAGSGVQVDPWADEAAIQGEAVAATPESIETPTTPAATLIAAEPAPADSTTDEIPTADVEREIEYEARQPVSTWERLQFWRTRR
jgi:hypothetical protein